MREILFRGKRLDNGEWVDGFYVMFSTSIEHPYSYTNGKHYIQTVPHNIRFEVDPETVCQYTGLTDKDSKKIFEGDILSFIDRECPDDILRELVAWNGFSWVTRRCKSDVVMSEWECEKMEVVGNIFDNPELLEGGVNDIGMDIDKMIEQLLDIDIVQEDNTVVFSDEAKQLIHEIAEKCNSIPIVDKTKEQAMQYGEGYTAEQIYIDMLYKIVNAPTQVHMRMVARMLIPIIYQKLSEGVAE